MKKNKSVKKWHDDKTPLWITKDLKNELKEIGTKGETFNDIVEKLLYSYKKDNLEKEK